MYFYIYRESILVSFVFLLTSLCIADKMEITNLFDPNRPELKKNLGRELQLSLRTHCIYTPSGNALSYGSNSCGVAPRINYFGDLITTNFVFDTNYKWLKYIRSSSCRKRVDTLSIVNEELKSMTLRDKYSPPYEKNQMLKISDYIKSFSIPFTFNMDYQSHFFMYFDLFPTSTGIHIYAKRNATESEVLEVFISGKVKFRDDFGNLSQQTQDFSDYHLKRYDKKLNLAKQPLASLNIIIPPIGTNHDIASFGAIITNILGKAYSLDIYSEHMNFEQACSWIFTDLSHKAGSSSKHVIRQYSEKSGCFFILTYQILDKNIASREIVEQLDINVENYIKHKPSIAALPFPLSDLHSLKKSKHFKGKAIAVSGSDDEILFCFTNTINHPVLGFTYEHDAKKSTLFSQKLYLKSISFFTGRIPSRFFYMSNYSQRTFAGQGRSPPVLVIPMLSDEM